MQINERAKRRRTLSAMFGIFSSTAARLFIDRGTVRCPLRCADVEVDTCLTCQWLLEIEEDAATPFVRCQPVRPGGGIKPAR